MSLNRAQKAFYEETVSTLQKGAVALGERNQELAESCYMQAFVNVRAFLKNLTDSYDYAINKQDLDSMAAVAIEALFYSENDFAAYLESHKDQKSYIVVFKNSKDQEYVMPNLSFRDWMNPTLEPINGQKNLSYDPFGGWSRHFSITAKRLKYAARFSTEMHITTSSSLVADDYYLIHFAEKTTVTILLKGKSSGYIDSDKELIKAANKLRSRGVTVELISQAGESICLL